MGDYKLKILMYSIPIGGVEVVLGDSMVENIGYNFYKL